MGSVMGSWESETIKVVKLLMVQKSTTLRILGMSWGVKITCFEAPGVSLGGSGVSIGGVRILRAAHAIRDQLSNQSKTLE